MSNREQKSIAPSSERALSRALRKSKVTAGTSTTPHSHNSVAMTELGDSEDEYEPGDKESEEDREDVTRPETLKDTHVSSHRDAVMDKEAKRLHADEQVGFIILQRDNNKPDAYGESSETHGPLPWPVVAVEYNKKYKTSIGPAAMEKRARQHRGAWMAKRPSYPSKIVYAKKPKAEPIRRSKVVAGEHEADYVQGNAEKQHVRAPDEAARADRSQIREKPSEGYISNDRIGGWMPPDVIRNGADLHSYIDHTLSKTFQRVVIEVFDAQGLPSQSLVADCGGLVNSSAVLRQWMDGRNKPEMQLHCLSMDAVQWYVRWISSHGLTELPAHSHRGGSSLVELYCFATQLQDDHVRGLIRTLWNCLPETGAETNLSIEDLNLLFDGTCSEDPARKFWVDTVYTEDLSDRLIQMGDCNTELVADMQNIALRRSK